MVLSIFMFSLVFHLFSVHKRSLFYFTGAGARESLSTVGEEIDLEDPRPMRSHRITQQKSQTQCIDANAAPITKYHKQSN